MDPLRRLKNLGWAALLMVAGLLLGGEAYTALVVPNEIQQPGTQPGQVSTLESPDKCDNCHGGYDRAVEPAFNWRGSMMANAGRDPIFWATVAIAEQDFDGSGDLCIRCHSSAGWHAGRSVPTDGSGLAASDADGVDCDTCHKATNPSNAEHLGTMTAPFIANDEASPATGYYGSGMLSLFGGSEKLGPYSDATPNHQFAQSKFHRDVSFCGSCHDVSNAAVGDLAHNNGRQPTAVGSVIATYVLGSPVAGKAAFNNFPFQYGVVERTFSEHMAGALSKTRVSAYASLPADLKSGAIKAAFDSAKGDYADGAPRFFSCQTCHMPAVTGQGCNKNPAVRSDLPLHDLTGGNVWAPDVILYQNTQGTLRLGGAMTAGQIEATQAGKARALRQLQLAAALSVSGNTLKVTNLTGHKLISGYPEGRRMWLNIKWYDATGGLLREDGKYGDLAVSTPGAPATVKTILDPGGANTRIYEAHYAMTQEWASQLLALGKPSTMPLSFDRVTGNVTYTLGQLAAQSPGTYHETFHFVLNNHVAKDNRIPTYGMSYDEALKRNALPTPPTQYGNPGPGGTYRYWDEVPLSPPAGAARATIDLLYQSTSWEYVQFLHVANNRSNAFLANEGVNLLNAWANTGMAAPAVMASAAWTAPGIPPRVATDLNLDGRSDILWHNQSTGQVYRLLMNGLAITGQGIAYTEPDTAWKIVGDADFNGDGVTDLLWRHQGTGHVSIVFFAANALPSNVAQVWIEPNAAWKIVATPDLDGDGRGDILWWNSTTGQVYAMIMNGAAITRQGFVLTEPNTAWKIDAVGDFAGSGARNQLVWRNSSTGQVWLMTVTLNGAGGFSQTGQMIYQEPNTAWRIVAAADFNGDSRAEILWRHEGTGQIYMMFMSAGIVSGGAMVHREANLAWKVHAVGDYNGDGKADLLWRNQSNGLVYLMLMNGAAIASQAMVYGEPNLDWKILGPLEYSLS